MQRTEFPQARLLELIMALLLKSRLNELVLLTVLLQ